MATRRMPRPPLAPLSAPVSLGCTAVEPTMPAPHVHYPSHYGVFIGFAASAGSVPALCTCVRPLLEADPGASPITQVGDPWRASAFPDAVVASVKATGAFSYADGACHRCVRAAPSVRWCHEMYGGKFKQTFGWYIQQAGRRLRLGVTGDEAVERSFAIANAAREDARRERASFQWSLVGFPSPPDGPTPDPGALVGVSLSPADAARLLLLVKCETAAERAVDHLIENSVRDAFGYPRVGERWRSETELRGLVRQLFPDETVVVHDRPPWLDGLELDIHLPARRLAFEYQGRQHFHPVEAWGGKPALSALRERDARKAEACRRAGVTLVFLTYEEVLDLDVLRARLAAVVE